MIQHPCGFWICLDKSPVKHRQPVSQTAQLGQSLTIPAIDFANVSVVLKEIQLLPRIRSISRSVVVRMLKSSSHAGWSGLLACLISTKSVKSIVSATRDINLC